MLRYTSSSFLNHKRMEQTNIIDIDFCQSHLSNLLITEELTMIFNLKIKIMIPDDDYESVECEEFLPLTIRSIKGYPASEYTRGTFAVSNDRQFICLITNIEMNHIRIRTPKLFQLDSQQLIKTFEQIRWALQYRCHFNDDSNILIIQDQEQYTIYMIKSNQILKFNNNRFPDIKFSYDNSRYLCGTKQEGIKIHNYPFSKKEKPFLNPIKNFNWSFAQQSNNLLLSLKIMFSFQLALQYYRIKNNKLFLILSIQTYGLKYNEESFNYLEISQCKLVILYSNKFIKIYNQKGKLIKKLITNISPGSNLTVQFKKDINNKSIIIVVYGEYRDTIKFTSLLPDIKTQLWKRNIFRNCLIFNCYGCHIAWPARPQDKEIQINLID